MGKSDAVKFYDTTDWQTLSWLSSGGTREKRILQAPDDSEWYFKCSERKVAKDGLPEKYYKFEFWSEIIAYQVGASLGLNILRYDIACNEEQVGCISAKMNSSEMSQLIEVGSFMTKINPDFIPDKNQARKEYTFQLLDDTLKHFDLEKYRIVFFQTLLFDAIIGNTDRHQENWAFIWDSYRDIPTKEFLKMISRLNFENIKKTTLAEEIKLRKLDIKEIAPIYDNGSSLGRELTEERVELLLNDPDLLDRYIKRGKSEVHWNKRKISHFKLIENILGTDNKSMLLESASFLENWNDKTINSLVSTIDSKLPKEYGEYEIPEKRKELIYKLLTLRYNLLCKLIYG